MRIIRFRVLTAFFVALFGILSAPTPALAVVQSLNGQTGQAQTFQNDSNIIISSSSNTHTINWQGLLPLSRGGTGASSFSSGSVLFSNGTSISQNNSNLFWDNTNNRLGIGTSSPNSALEVDGDTSISGNLSVGTPGASAVFDTSSITSSNKTYTFPNHNGNIIVDGVDTNFLGATFNADDLGVNNGNGLVFYSDIGTTQVGEIGVPSSAGRYRFVDDSLSFGGFLDFTSLTATQTFTFPDASGTLGLLGVNQTWNGLNKFEADTNSTIYVGSSAKSGCIALGDSDGSGVTYVTANDGVLTASTTKPGVCQ